MIRAFGLTVAGAGPPGARDDDVPADVRVTRVECARLEAAWSGGCNPPRISRGLRHRVERGRAGDHRIITTGGDLFHLDANARRLLCAPADPSHSGWRRELLDTVLVTTALARGREALHAAAVACDGGIVAVAAPSGGGKTTLVRELVARGHALVCDDVLVLERSAHGVLGLPGLPASSEASPAPGPVCALCLLDRRPGADEQIAPARPGVVAVLGSVLDSGSDPARRAARFAVAADLANQATVLRLTADVAVPAAQLADRLAESLTGAGAPGPRSR